MRIAIIGAGHAGVEAAAAARAAGADKVVLYSAEAGLPYYRPRLVALAFGQATADAIRMHPEAWYAEQGITLRLNTPVRGLQRQPLAVHLDGGLEPADAAVVACGARALRPPVEGLDVPRVFTLWNEADAHAIRAALRPGAHLAILGGGILGIEAALRALDAGCEVTIVERLDRLMPSQFGARASTVLLRELNARHIHVHLGRTLAHVAGDAESGTVALQLDNGDRLVCDALLVSAGARPDLALARAAGLGSGRGLTVSASLENDWPRVFGAGDVVELAGVTRCSVREAAAQGRVAGVNAVAAVRGLPMQVYQPATHPVSLKSGDFEVYALGQPGGEGYDERDFEAGKPSALRTLVHRHGVLVGVQMIGTREAFDTYARQVQME